MNRTELLFRIVAIILTWKCAFLTQNGNPASENSLQNVTCKQLFRNQTNGEFSSPNFPSGPPDNSICTVEIQMQEGSKLEIEFEVFMLKDDKECKNEFIQISYNGKNTSSTKLCGKKDSLILTVFEPKTVILYQTGNDSYPGFLASFRITDNENVTGRADTPCPCGKKQRNQFRRIVGGSQLIEPYEFPWLCILVLPYSVKSAHCGCAIISPKHVITAAHCTYKKTTSSYLVVAGVNDITLTSKQLYRQTRKISKITQHPQYDRDIENYDISILELAEPFTMSQGIWPICLPPKGNLFVGETGVAAGWGKTQYMGKNSNLPLEVSLPIVSNKECTTVFENTNANITNYMLCAGVLNGSIDACQGDSGGPLMWKNPDTNIWSIIGIISYGVKCATPDYYGVYTRISELIDYIQESVDMKGKTCLVEALKIQ